MNAIKNLQKKFRKLFKDDDFISKEEFLEYIHENVGENRFIFLLLVGPSQLGKSTLGNFLSNCGKKKFFKIGESNSSCTKKAEIAYAGKIGDIINNTGCKHLLNENPHLLDNNYHVFICDTEGIQATTKDHVIATFIFPFMHLASKIVYFIRIEPDNTKAKFLEVCEKISEDMGRAEYNSGNSMFDDKLIIRVRDFPKLISIKKSQQQKCIDEIEEEEEEEDNAKEEIIKIEEKKEEIIDMPQYTIEEAIDIFNHGDMAHFMTGGIEGHNGAGLPIQCAPGGYWPPEDKRSFEYNQYLVSLLINNIDSDLVFTP